MQGPLQRNHFTLNQTDQHLTPTHATGISAIELLRQTSHIAPGDSIFRAIDTLRYMGVEALPVVDEAGNLVGEFDSQCLKSILASGSDDISAPVSSIMNPPAPLCGQGFTQSEIARCFQHRSNNVLFFVDERGRYIGSICSLDILAPSSEPIRPGVVGGMATPWGVYLTNGSIQAGVNNFALAGSGMMMALLMWLAAFSVGLGSYVTQKLISIPVFSLWNSPQPTVLLWQNCGWFVLHALPVLMFFILMRLMPLAGYHAAEHQAVHTMERGDLLLPEVLSRMPRVHPRCGTNIMAGAMIFLFVSETLPALHIGLGPSDSTVLGALVALFTWRSLGAVIQQYFTTRPATDKQLASGIRAAEELERKFLTTGSRRPNPLRRIWCMGLIQVAIGASLLSWFLGVIFGNVINLPF